MRISQTSSLSEPSGADRIPEGTLGYFRARNRHRVYSLVLREFKRSGISQADLARRLGKGTDVVCRWLGSPGNWTLDTLSDLLFAMSGAEAGYSVQYPLGAALSEKVIDGDAVTTSAHAFTRVVERWNENAPPVVTTKTFLQKAA
jgi:hypothetical protein